MAIVLSFLIFFGWQKFYIEPQMQTGRNKAQPTTSAPANPTDSSKKSDTSIPSGSEINTSAPDARTAIRPVTPSSQRVPPESKALAVSTGAAKVGNGSKIFTDWDLKSYRLGISPEAAAVDLSSVTRQEGEGELAFDLQEYAYLTNVQGKLTTTPNGVAWNYEDENVKIVRETRSTGEHPYVDVLIRAEFKNRRPNYAFVSLNSHSPSDDEEAHDRQLVYWSQKSIERVPLDDSIALQEVPTPVKWIGTTSRYFLMTLVSQGNVEPKGLIQPVSSRTGRVSLVYPVTGNTIEIPLKAYFGPKEIDVVRAVDPTLDHTLDFGWFTVFAYPLLRLMKWFYQIFHNYGVSIILLTLLVKILTYPLTYKSMKSMKSMAKLQPQLQKIREKYKDDREALNREMLTLMKSHGYNPMAGCLPILIQMPVFFALYRVLYSSIELYHAPFVFWIQDLSAKDPFYVTPILLTLTMFIQQKLTPTTATDPMQAKMLQLMPVIFGVFMLTLPSGLTIYMLVNALASIVQQLIMNKKLDMGHVRPVAARAR